MDVPCPDPHQTDGYLVLLKPAAAVAEWQHQREQFERNATEAATYLAAVRVAFPDLEPSCYRGISRYPVDRWRENETPGDERDALARLRLWELYDTDPTSRWRQPPWFDPDLLLNLEAAQEVLSLTDAPSERELLRVARGETIPGPKTIGFDVGYWGSDHFSIIADAMVMPRWHGCPAEQLGSLAVWGQRLNKHLLFPTAAGASEYLAWYVGQPWAETEDPAGQFQIIRADLTS